MTMGRVARCNDNGPCSMLQWRWAMLRGVTMAGYVAGLHVEDSRRTVLFSTLSAPVSANAALWAASVR